MASPQIAPLDTDADEMCSATSAGTFCMANILLPVDFSEPCARAVRTASMLARCFGSEVTVLHVQAAVLDFEGTRNSGLKERLESFERTTLEGLGVRRLLLRGNDPARAILELERCAGIDAILMPTYGTGPFRKLNLGSVTESVLQRADCPVWTNVHQEGTLYFDRKAIRKIVCAVDRDSRARRVLAWARDFSRTVGAALTLVHATAPVHRTRENGWPEELRRNGEAALNRRLDEFGFQADVHVEIGNVTPVVTMATKNLNADLLVIGRSTESGPFGSIETNSYSLIRHSNCPVVSV
jgi:nucleotide-binding universal stress UspA family protein